MKHIVTIVFSIFILLGCQQNDEPVVRQETGVVVNYAGSDYCSIVIELDNGQNIQPLYYPEGFEFIEGQRLLVSYSELSNVTSTCGKGTACELLNVEVLNCGSPIIETEKADTDSFPNDPVNIHEIAVNGDCLYLMVSYSGGCQNHEFNLVKQDEEEENADMALLELRHDSNNDFCEAAISKELQYDLVSLKKKGYTKFQFTALLESGETFRKVFELEP